MLIEHGGEAILTDPVFSNRIGRFFTKRTSRSLFRPEQVRRIAGILISHAHHDHLDYRSLSRIGRSVPIVVPWGVALPLRLRRHIDIRVTRRWETRSLGEWQVTAVPSRHFGGRLPFIYSSGHQGYVLTGPTTIYFAGDTGWDEAMFLEIGRRFDLELAVLPIAGAVLPWFRRNHMNAEDAIRAFHRLGARRMLPMHFGTFPASFEPVDHAARRIREEAARQGIDHRVEFLAEGESLYLDAGATSGATGPGARSERIAALVG